MEETKLLTGSERDNFTSFAAALDAHLYQKYYEYLDKMKVGVHLYGGGGGGILLRHLRWTIDEFQSTYA